VSNATARPHICPQGCHRSSEPVGKVDGVTGEVLHLRFAEHAGAFAGESTAETLDTRHTEDLSVDVERDRVTLQHGGPPRSQHLGDIGIGVAVVVVIAEHRHHRDTQVGELVGNDLRLVPGHRAG
jgi:hypothetical protein